MLNKKALTIKHFLLMSNVQNFSLLKHKNSRTYINSESNIQFSAA